MAGVGARRTATLLVFGATVRMEFRGANGAKDCANREDDRLVILPRCAGHVVWLKTSQNQVKITHAGRCEPPQRLPLFKLALVLVRLDHVARGIVNANHSVARYQARPYMRIRRRPSRQEMH